MEKERELTISNGIKIINAKMIEFWIIKDRRFFEGIFPDIIKELIIESTEGKIQNLRLPSGDNIWIPGVDGQLINLNDNKWLGSKGKIILEIGTTLKTPWVKIKKDFEKRNTEILDKEKQETTFIIFSGKILPSKKKKDFCKENQGKWLDLKIYDALDLENWLQECTNTTLYFYEKIEGKKLNYNSLEYAWTNFKKQTNPELSTSFLTVGRKDNVEKLKNYIENRNSSHITIKSLSRTESYGFVLSVLFEYYQNNNFIIVINDINTFEEITKKVSNKIFILNFYFEQCIFPSNNHYIVFFWK
ncbi:hypothetical protein [Spiroplasma attinicola]|uniref:hypothetical protein n=1 Tax=Spiroplasma attinicola TaxID=2904537 RepID=UPI002022A4B3|nr:hypothetical protein [Spiroplasma sp. JKS002670]MCL8209552.1 hypothetical protein [Spiroplasma sp. JKS002670]